MEVYLGLIFPFTGAYAPQYTAQCLGQQMQVSQNQALFAITGAMFTFGRMPADASSRTILRRRAGLAARGSSFLASSSSSVTIVTVTCPEPVAHSRCHRSRSRSTRALLVIVDTA